MATPKNTSTPPRPSTGTILARGMTLRCPRCGQGGLFHRWTEMIGSCPKCQLHFEQEEGYWLGALVVNTMVALTLFSLAIGITVAVTWPNIPVYTTMIVGMTGGIIFPFFFYPISKTFWVALDLAFLHPERLQAGTSTSYRR